MNDLQVDYATQLTMSEWRKKREEILFRDQCRCTICGEGASFLGFSEYVRYTIFNVRLPITYNPEKRMNVNSHVDVVKFVPNSRRMFFTKISSYPFVIGILEDTKEVVTTLFGSAEEAVAMQNEDLYLHEYMIDNVRSYVLSYTNDHLLIDLPLIRYSTESDAETYRLPTHAGIYVNVIPTLNIHHKYYVFNNYIWEVPDSALTTLCHSCHMMVHKHNKIPFYSSVPEAGQKAVYYRVEYEPCSRCGGTGNLPMYKHIQGGVCFKCGGRGCFIESETTGLQIMSEVDHTNK